MWVKFGVRGPHVMLFRIGEFRENRGRKGRPFETTVNQIALTLVLYCKTTDIFTAKIARLQSTVHVTQQSICLIVPCATPSIPAAGPTEPPTAYRRLFSPYNCSRGLKLTSNAFQCLGLRMRGIMWHTSTHQRWQNISQGRAACLYATWYDSQMIKCREAETTAVLFKDVNSVSRSYTEAAGTTQNSSVFVQFYCLTNYSLQKASCIKFSCSTLHLIGGAHTSTPHIIRQHSKMRIFRYQLRSALAPFSSAVWQYSKPLPSCIFI